MYTTIKITKELKEMLNLLRVQESETYAHVIEDLIEDRLSLNPEFVKEIEERRKEVKKGKLTSIEELKKEFGLHV